MTLPLRDCCVLVIDDDVDSRELIRRMLEYHGALVVTAASVKEARQHLQTLLPRVVVTDIVMPDDGIHLLDEIRALVQEHEPDTPVIAVTGFRERREELRAGGFTDVIVKPVNPLSLRDVILKHCGPE